MGIIVQQSVRNTVSTYLGFGIGAINTLFLFTYFLSDVYYGLVSYLLSIAGIMMPLLTFGVQNTLIKFFSGYTSAEDRNRFLTLMFFLPLLIIVPLGIVGYVSYEWIASLLSDKNAVIKDYLWVTYGIAFAMAYFEVFYAWARVNMKTVFGNFLKEVFQRIAITLLLFMVFFEWLTVTGFIYGIAVTYFIRMLLMLFSSLRIKKPQWAFKRPRNTPAVLTYSGFVILAGAVSIVLLDIDKLMIGQFKTLENVAYYNVAVYIAMVIVVPSRAMQQIIIPITAKLINAGEHRALKDLYERSSLTLYVIGGFIFLLIVLNIGELYELLPGQYGNGVIVVFIIALAKLLDNLLGNNNAILFNSRYYKTVLLFGILLVVLTIGLNLVFIPLWGINGAALATLLAFVIYNAAKIGFVAVAFKMQPFSLATLKTTGVLLLFLLLFSFWDFSFHPLVNIGLKSALLAFCYGMAILRLRLSEDLLDLLLGYLKK